MTGYPKPETDIQKPETDIQKQKTDIQSDAKCARRWFWITVVIGDRAHSPGLADLDVPVGGGRSAGRFLNDVYR